MGSVEWREDKDYGFEVHILKNWAVARPFEGWELSGPLAWSAIPLEAQTADQAKKEAEQIIAARLREALAQVEGETNA